MEAAAWLMSVSETNFQISAEAEGIFEIKILNSPFSILHSKPYFCKKPGL